MALMKCRSVDEHPMITFWKRHQNPTSGSWDPFFSAYKPMNTQAQAITLLLTADMFYDVFLYVCLQIWKGNIKEEITYWRRCIHLHRVCILLRSNSDSYRVCSRSVGNTVSPANRTRSHLELIWNIV